MDIIGRAYMLITSGNSRVEKRINMIEAGSTPLQGLLNSINIITHWQLDIAFTG